VETPPLPPPRGSSAYAVALVCTGNICRSPMAHVVLESRLHAAGLADRVLVTSGGTGPWHVGEPMDERAAATLRRAGYDPSRHRARQVTGDWFTSHDLVLGMDRANMADLAAVAPDATARERLLAFRAFDPDAAGPDAEVPDPWFGGPEGFADVLATVERTADALTTAFGHQLSR